MITISILLLRSPGGQAAPMRYKITQYNTIYNRWQPWHAILYNNMIYHHIMYYNLALYSIMIMRYNITQYAGGTKRASSPNTPLLRLQSSERNSQSFAKSSPYGQFSKSHVCFCGLDTGNLKFETVRTNKQHICFQDLRRST